VDPGARRNDSEEDQDGIHGKMFELYLTTIPPIVKTGNRTRGSRFMKRTVCHCERHSCPFITTNAQTTRTSFVKITRSVKIQKQL
ncbi:hypothetical protein PILCRDRAFT_826527, partial [Piloderma croceum F 1598]